MWPCPLRDRVGVASQVRGISSLDGDLIFFMVYL